MQQTDVVAARGVSLAKVLRRVGLRVAATLNRGCVTHRVEAQCDNNGNSATKYGHHQKGSNGNGASTTHNLAGRGGNPLAHTAEGKAPAGLVEAPLNVKTERKLCLST